MALNADEVYAILKKQIQSGGGTPGPAGVGIQKIEKTGTDGLVDTYTITYTNGQAFTYTVTNGANGKDGNPGAKGDPGEDGITPTIGENGNWYLGDEDTGKPSRGEKGDAGDGVPSGGTTGQVLTKNSNSDGDASWKNPSGVSDEQVKTAVRDYFEENPPSGVEIDDTLTQEGKAADAKITGEKLSGKVDKKQGVKFESIGFGKACRYGTGYFTGNIIDESTTAFGSFGIIIECNAGDTLYCNFTLASSGITSVQILDNIPTKNNGTLTGVIGTISQQENGEYKIPDNLTNAKAAFFPQKFWSYPSEKPETFDKNYGITVQTQPFDIFPAIYNSSYISEMQNENLYVDQDKNMVLYASLYKAVSDMVGAKVYISGDSITEQSAAIVSGDGTQKGWYDRIGIKYMQQYEAHGHSGNMWYTSSTLQNSAVEDVKSIVEAGIEYDYVVFEWGTNDITLGNFGNADDQASADTNCGTVAAIKYCIENLQSNFPKTRIIVIMPCMRNKNPRQEQYYDLVDPILKSYGVRRVYMAYDSGITVSMMNSDGIHFRYQDTDGTYKQNMIGIEKYSKCLEAEMLNA